MVTMGIGLMLFEAANKAAFITGGVDGLSGMVVGKVLGIFDFDLEGRVAYLYSLVVLFVVFVVLRRMVYSPFGLGLRGLHYGPKRMPAIGASVYRRQIAIFTVGAGVAGIAGALLAFVILANTIMAAWGVRLQRWRAGGFQKTTPGGVMPA